MNKSLHHSKQLFLVVLTVFLIACGGGSSGGSGNGGTFVFDSPEIALIEEVGFIHLDANVECQASFKVKLDLNKVSGSLQSLEFLENGVAVDPAKLIINNGAIVSASPLQLTSDDNQIYEVEIHHADGVHPGDQEVYSFIVHDENGLTKQADITISYYANAPDIAFIEESGFISLDADVEHQESFKVKLDLNKGTGYLQTLSILENGMAIDPSKLLINNGSVLSANPLSLPVDANQIYEIEIEHADTVSLNDQVSYSFIIQDEHALSEQVDVLVTFIEVLTPISTTYPGINLFNAERPNKGAIDLSAGTAVDETDIGANIRDMGIDCSVVLSENWRSQLGAVNGTELRKVDLSQMPGLDFDAVAYKETIEEAYLTGIVLNDGASENVVCSQTAVDDVSDILAADDLFVALAEGNYYLIRINSVMPNAANDNDKISIAIKY